VTRKSFVVLVALLGWVSLCLLAAGEAAPTGIRFQKEHITIFVHEKSIRVDGLYTFINPDPSPCRQALFYPIPTDSLHPAQDYVLVRAEGRVLATKPFANGVAFGVTVPASGQLTVEVIYEQSSRDRSGCYILTSTAEWEAPLEHASFEIRVPEGIDLDWMAYDADTVLSEGGERIYAFSRTEFMPEKDLCIRWRPGAE
jgi:hypothetical protein